VSGYVLQSRSQKPLLWAGLTAAAALSYYVLAYLSLDNRFFSLPTNLQMIPHFWSGLAFALSLLGCFIVNHLLNAIPSTYGQKQNILALYVGTATAFLSIALSIEIDPQFLPIAFAFQFLALSAIYTKVNIPNIRYFIATLAGLFIICKIAIIFVLIDLFTSAITDTISYLPQSDFNTPKIYYHLIHLGIPALCFLAASYLLRQKDERDSFATWFEKAFIALVAITTYFTVDVIFLKSEQVTSFVERGITTNLFFIYAIGCFMIAQKYNRKAFEYGGYALVGLAALRLGYFEYLLYNPLWTKQSVGIYPLFNWLLFVYALPILFIYYILKIIPQPIQNFVSKCGYGSILLLAFTFVSFNVRQFYHGEFLNAYTTSNIEIYSYSAAWTLLGIGLLFYGTLKQDKMLRIASLIIMLLTIGKVFLYDASELEGLYRVVSFFILGVVLIGLSWFYTKFVFKKS
jgi:uncharacterized membrane protein